MTESCKLVETCLRDCPCGVLVVDENGVIQQINRTLETMLSVSAEHWQGRTLDSITNPLYRPLFQDGGLIHLNGPGITRELWLQCSLSSSGGLTSRYFVDATETIRLRTENEHLQQQVQELTITDELTGLANRRALTGALNSQVTRSRRYNNPLSLAIIELYHPTDEQPAFDNQIILATSRYLRDRLRWVDLIARWDDRRFVVLLPETNADDSRRLIEDISQCFQPEKVSDDARWQSLELRFGLAQWQKGNDSRLLMERAAEELTAGHETDKPAAAL